MHVIPEIGRLVVIRKRAFVVSDIQAQGLPPEENTILHTNHLVKLSPIEDDSLGEDAEVIWELEPGAISHERASLPNPEHFDNRQVLDAFFDAVRWVQSHRLTTKRSSHHAVYHKLRHNRGVLKCQNIELRECI